MTDFKDTKIYTGQELAKSPVTQALSTGMASQQSLAVAKIQAALVVAQGRPRDEDQAIRKILKSCQRRLLAERAEYAYKRGTTVITGPSIHIAKVISTHWQNMKFGFREIGTGPDYTEVEAFAWDLETNTEATRVFKVYNRRYTGDQKLTKQRDLDENLASVAQRRVRACIQQVIPEDVFDAAVEACRKTLQAADSRPLDEKIRSMIKAFKKIGVTEDMLEGFLGHPVTSAVEAQVITLRNVYRSIKDGIGSIDEFFNMPSAVEEAKKRIEASEKQKKPRKPRSDKGKQRKKAETTDDTSASGTDETSESNENTDTELDEKIKSAALESEFNPIEELYSLADQLWGQTAGSQLAKVCEKHGVDLSQLTERDANLMIDVVNEQLELTKSQNE